MFSPEEQQEKLRAAGISPEDAGRAQVHELTYVLEDFPDMLAATRDSLAEFSTDVNQMLADGASTVDIVFALIESNSLSYVQVQLADKSDSPAPTAHIMFMTMLSVAMHDLTIAQNRLRELEAK